MPGCSGCDASCCRRYVVPVSAADARRLVQATGRALEEFVVASPDADGFLVTPQSPRHALALDRRPDGSCVFLDDDGLCTVYEHRPRTCRVYPAGVDAGDLVCPGPLDLAGAALELFEMRQEWAEHDRLVADYNERVRAQPDRVFMPEEFFGLVARAPTDPTFRVSSE